LCHLSKPYKSWKNCLLTAMKGNSSMIHQDKPRKKREPS
jgi:hypothetical protein